LRAVCRKCYVHPAVLETYLDGTRLEALKQETEQELADTLHSLKPEEAAVVALLGCRLAQEAAKKWGQAMSGIVYFFGYGTSGKPYSRQSSSARARLAAIWDRSINKALEPAEDIAGLLTIIPLDVHLGFVIRIMTLFCGETQTPRMSANEPVRVTGFHGQPVVRS